MEKNCVKTTKKSSIGPRPGVIALLAFVLLPLMSPVTAPSSSSTEPTSVQVIAQAGPAPTV